MGLNLVKSLGLIWLLNTAVIDEGGPLGGDGFDDGLGNLGIDSSNLLLFLVHCDDVF